ncbi:hypothetical protein GLOTRDRAFT_131959 [Gloeophyllum trabeum ATCC 11539]|uniref:Uncharacterized protein n=1 Tax=Gloeophyllum trabeum (strain ATCC 11539 / FP-39264 / Madison 617) TaxID=670483 RepID=S7PZJ7_GLOTA|nr:uncharacterized protein GLOTRDRAFT_131959 [Gloeophyllum trabeum ATCC 11539]EPQ52722.1 hypothetical protein GLOTRDRAFT_131959 [Gloeophyllum trabeum ATCC 11539]
MSGKALPTLTEWSKQHISAVFESRNDAESLRAVEETFSPDVRVLLNGTPVNREGVKQLVVAMRRAAPAGLKVDWQVTVDVPKDPSNRNGAFGGVYVVRGQRKELPGTKGVVDIERHKSVNVVIQSQSEDPSTDSRKIVNLVFVAADLPTRAKL